MFVGPGQPRRPSRHTSNEDLWELDTSVDTNHQRHQQPSSSASSSHHAHDGQNAALSRTGSVVQQRGVPSFIGTSGTADGSGLLRIRGDDALPSMYHPQILDSTAVAASTGSSPKQPSLHATHQEGFGRQLSHRSRNTSPIVDDFPSSVVVRVPSRRASAPQSTSSDAAGGTSDQDYDPRGHTHLRPQQQQVFNVLFFQDHVQCPILPIDGRDNSIVLMRPGYFSIRLESEADSLSIAKLEIDGCMTRCNFRLQPHTKHTVRETRLDVGQHAVPLTFDPSETQMQPIETSEDVDRHVGCLRILFYEAYERPGTLKWEWDVGHPAEVICLDYGNLESFFGVYPSLRVLAPDVLLSNSAPHPRRVSMNGADHRVTTTLSSNPSQRGSEAFERHVQRSMRTKSRNAVNTTGPAAGARATAKVSQNIQTQADRGGVVEFSATHKDPNNKPVDCRSKSPQPLATNITARYHSTTQLVNPLACLDRAAGRQPSSSLQTTTSEENAGRRGGCCVNCRAVLDEERKAFASREESFRQEIEFLTKRLRIAEGRSQPQQQQGVASRSSSTGSIDRRSKSPVVQTSSQRQGSTDKGRHHSNSAGAAPASKETRASRLREGRFASHPEVSIDPAGSGRWRSSSTGSDANNATRNDKPDSGDRILAFAQEVIAAERMRQQRDGERRGGAERSNGHASDRTRTSNNIRHHGLSVVYAEDADTSLWGVS